MEKLGLIRRLWNFIRRCECVEETPPPAAVALSEPEQFALELQTFEVPTKKVKGIRKKNVRHLWADRFMERITGVGNYTAKIPAYAKLEVARNTLSIRLNKRFGRNKWATSLDRETRRISVLIYEV